ncbi:hypothetical protein A1F94_009974 [Pyrenophora tritici-repentis]|uniref:Uncharacterized protein n=1 Tax=Pyrenophora tritici-repentis TaxID=45151 RepID=A0A316ZVU3_9PLEO|nr:hypothetical protein PtrV1_10933 [Pyrenophora tritici-repentis]KAF7443880.1 hypothetical protein A1F99_119540 [Pyrenophora tritici-repentis]KAG9379618.1 hypothetical protein A1F94_009974 [Pyrenophora tritici-repentis]KAI1519347.1 hypothetical protein Ptr86124_002475 [Pyrenophora tritici-repentis]KAI1679199.1 hypothetical protein KJE20_11381 [Pyrenophora tritici-repentis]
MSGLSRVQLGFCLRNIRAREKHLLEGHSKKHNNETTVHAGSGKEPFKNSSYVQPVLKDSDYDMSLPSCDSLYSLSSMAGPSTPLGYNPTVTQTYESPREDSRHQVLRAISNTHEVTLNKRKGRRHRNQRHQQGRTGIEFDAASMSILPGLGMKYPCTECLEVFKMLVVGRGTKHLYMAIVSEYGPVCLQGHPRNTMVVLSAPCLWMQSPNLMDTQSQLV